MGLSLSPRVYTKILKPVFSELCKKGHISSIYLDDSWLMGKTLQQCEENVFDTVTLLDNLGFMVHDRKSVFVPSKEIQNNTRKKRQDNFTLLGYYQNQTVTI